MASFSLFEITPSNRLRKPMLRALEPRILLDAAGVATAQDMIDDAGIQACNEVVDVAMNNSVAPPWIDQKDPSNAALFNELAKEIEDNTTPVPKGGEVLAGKTQAEWRGDRTDEEKELFNTLSRGNDGAAKNPAGQNYANDRDNVSVQTGSRQIDCFKSIDGIGSDAPLTSAPPGGEEDVATFAATGQISHPTHAQSDSSSTIDGIGSLTLRSPITHLDGDNEEREPGLLKKERGAETDTLSLLSSPVNSRR